MDRKAIRKLKIPNCIERKINDRLQEIIDKIQDGIFITDGNGKVIMLNQISLKFCPKPYSYEDLIGRNMSDMVREEMFDDALCMEAINTKGVVSAIQKNSSSSLDLLVTANPLMSNGEVIKVIITERDITELNQLVSIQSQFHCKSKFMEELLDTSMRIASLDATVLIEGESGTGKSLLARTIHNSGMRRDGPFIEINCAAIPDTLLESELFGYEKGAFTGALDRTKVGLFELASQGTLFLDEVGVLPIHLQTKILRAIQEKEVMRIGGGQYIAVDIRIIAATNTNLVEAINRGEFRRDLYFRLNVIPLYIKPLRNRREDIQCLAEFFVDKFNKKYNSNKIINPKAWELINENNWPGNIRELENFIERLIITTESDTISEDIILEFLNVGDGASSATNIILQKSNIKNELDTIEKSIIQALIKDIKSEPDLANLLGISLPTLKRRLKKYDLKV